MAYVYKDANGKIVASSATENLGEGWSFIENDSKEYITYLEDALAEHTPFRESDIQLARVLEDLISLLIERDMIRFTDFPRAAQKRLLERQTMRKRSELSGIVDDDIII